MTTTHPGDGETDQPPLVVAGRRVLVVGVRVAGAATARALLRLGASVDLADDVRLPAVDELAALGANYLGSPTRPPEGTDLVVASPGIRMGLPLFIAARMAGIEVIGEVELAWRLRGPQAPPWLCVTGTNGKTTTVHMLESILRAAGLRTLAVGNVGLPVIEAVVTDQVYDVLAVELSSYQLAWSTSVRPAAGALLNLAPDHLDWHGSMDAYAAAKVGVWRAGVAVGNADDPEVAGLLALAPAPLHVAFTTSREPEAGEVGVSGGMLVDRAFSPSRRELAALGEVRPAGRHNVANALAAAALALAYGVPAGAVATGLRDFVPDPHRNAFVASVGGVDYVDDSKATNPHAAQAALGAYRRVVWIGGGQLKGVDIEEFVAGIAARPGVLAGAVLLGADRGEIAAALARHAPEIPVIEVARTDDRAMLDVVRAASSLARPGRHRAALAGGRVLRHVLRLRRARRALRRGGPRPARVPGTPEPTRDRDPAPAGVGSALGLPGPPVHVGPAAAALRRTAAPVRDHDGDVDDHLGVPARRQPGDVLVPAVERGHLPDRRPARVLDRPAAATADLPLAGLPAARPGDAAHARGPGAARGGPDQRRQPVAAARPVPGAAQRVREAGDAGSGARTCSPARSRCARSPGPAHILVPIIPGFVLMCALVMAEPDLGTTLCFLIILMGLLWTVGLPLRYFGGVFAVIIAAVTLLAVLEPYRLQRLTSYTDPFRDRSGAGLQAVQGLYALASGGIFGVGLGSSTSKFGWVPNASTDYVFAVIGEELGLIGCLVVLATFGLFAYTALRVARRSEDAFIRLAASGTAVWICGQALINIGYVTGLLPVTGIPLPFVSAGGTSLVLTMGVLGMLLSFARHEPAAVKAAGRAARGGRQSLAIRLLCLGVPSLPAKRSRAARPAARPLPARRPCGHRSRHRRRPRPAAPLRPRPPRVVRARAPPHRSCRHRPGGHRAPRSADRRIRTAARDRHRLRPGLPL